MSKMQEQNVEEAKIRVILAHEIEKYHSYTGYEHLKKLIENSMITTLIKIRNNNFQNVEGYIKEMHEEILLIFHAYHTKKQEIRELSEDVYGTRDKQIKNEYEKLNRELRNGQENQDTKEAIEYIQSLIDGHHKSSRK